MGPNKSVVDYDLNPVANEGTIPLETKEMTEADFSRGYVDDLILSSYYSGNLVEALLSSVKKFDDESLWKQSMSNLIQIYGTLDSHRNINWSIVREEIIVRINDFVNMEPETRGQYMYELFLREK